ncbi:MAG: anti-sigma factor [Bacteroidetes bacterium]|nr:anti-sigma factor [Bacteroidota bacterium]MBP6314194.1 anti-sigma factor [Chitinophagaceae bacterium]
MNIAEYIASGILEQYVSGTASPQEMREVECMSHIYPEIKLELVEMQNALEALAISEAKTPPTFLKNVIFTALNELQNEDAAEISKEAIQDGNTGLRMELPPVEKEQLTATIFNRSDTYLKVAASILLLISVGLGVYSIATNSKLNSTRSELALARNEIKAKEQIIVARGEQIAVVSNLNFKPVLMKGIETKSPESAATIYWNTISQEVYISIASLPRPTDDKQYQLWAIADGKPVDLGMIDSKNIAESFQKMKAIGNAQAFAITLEKKGGVPQPTMTEMYVMGGV